MATFPSKHTPDQRDYVTLTISTAANGLSDIADLGGLCVRGVEMSTAWTDASLGFQGSPISSASMYAVFRVFSSSTAHNVIQFETSASRILHFQHPMLDGLRFVQLASLNPASTAALAQAASRSVRLLLAPPNAPIK